MALNINRAKLVVAAVAGSAVVALAVLVVHGRDLERSAPLSMASSTVATPTSATSSAARPFRTPRRQTPNVSASGNAIPVAAVSSDQPLMIVVPKAKGHIVPDGEVDEDAWAGVIGRTGGFTNSDGSAARPYSDARFLWGEGKLHLVLYAADEDIRIGDAKSPKVTGDADSFRLAFDDGKLHRTLEVSALGVLLEQGSRPSTSSPNGEPSSPWRSGATLGHDLDGTPNDPRDQDEEWVIEMDVPLASLGLEGKPGEKIGMSVERCDTPKGSPRACVSWGSPRLATLVLR